MSELDYNISLDIATGMFLHDDEEVFSDDRYTDDLNYDGYKNYEDENYDETEIEEIMQANNLEDVSRFCLFIPLEKQKYYKTKPYDDCVICYKCEFQYANEKYLININEKCLIDTKDLHRELTFCDNCYSKIHQTRECYILLYVEKFMFLKTFANFEDIFKIIGEIFILVCRESELKSTHFIQAQFKTTCCPYHNFLYMDLDCEYCKKTLDK